MRKLAIISMVFMSTIILFACDSKIEEINEVLKRIENLQDKYEMIEYKYQELEEKYNELSQRYNQINNELIIMKNKVENLEKMKQVPKRLWED